MTILKYAGLILLIFLSNCQKETSDSYFYFMTHPDELQAAYVKCEHSDDMQSCQTIQRASQDFMRLLNEQNQNPLGFGAKIIKTQQDLVRLQDNYELAKKEKDQNNLQLAKTAYQDQREQLQIYYTVVSKMISR